MSAAAASQKSAKPKASPAHPTYSVMIGDAITSLKERRGSSRAAILKYILKNFKVGDNEVAVNSRVKLALRSGVKASTLKQTKGTGASGSFKLGEKPKVAKPKKLVKKATKSPKKAKKPAAKKATKSPKKAKKPAAAKPKKSPKKAVKKTPAKNTAVRKPAAKKPAVKKPAVKKPAAKKAAKK